MTHHGVPQYVNLEACSSSVESKETFDGFGTDIIPKIKRKLDIKQKKITFTDVSIWSCSSHALELISRSSLLRLLKQKKLVALRSQKLGLNPLAGPAASCILAYFFLMLTFPLLIEGCAVRPRSVVVESTTSLPDASGFRPGEAKCGANWSGYCFNGGTCYMVKDAFDRYYPVCFCTKPFGGKRCDLITHPEMYEARISRLQVAAMSTVVVLIVAVAIICSSGLYFYRRHLKGKEETEGGFIRKYTKSFVGRYRNVQCTELQPLTVTTLQTTHLPDETRTSVIID